MVTRERFEEFVADALDALPAWVLERMENVEVVVADVPPSDQPNLLGLYHGIPLTKRGRGYTSVLPDTITLYRSTIMGIVRNENELRERIAHTVEHEIAHYFGISDERLHEIDRY